MPSQHSEFSLYEGTLISMYCLCEHDEEGT